MENKRYVNQLHWVFDLPQTAGLAPEGREPTRVMLFYDRTANLMQVEVLDRELPADVRENISTWLHNNGHLCDMINDLT